MEIIKTYVSFDGMEFDNEEECLEHENALKDIGNVCLFFDEYADLINDPTGEVVTCYSHYIIVRDAERAKDLFCRLVDTYGFEKPKVEIYDSQILRWDDCYDMWIDLQAQADEINKTIEDLKSVVKRIG